MPLHTRQQAGPQGGCTHRDDRQPQLIHSLGRQTRSTSPVPGPVPGLGVPGAEVLRPQCAQATPGTSWECRFIGFTLRVGIRMFNKHCRTDPSSPPRAVGWDGESQGDPVTLVTPGPGLQRTSPEEDRTTEARDTSCNNQYSLSKT